MPARAATDGAVFLFDIDGTLLHARGAGRAAFRAAFERLFAAPSACDAFSFAGLTDRLIARMGLRAAGLEPSEARIDALLAAYVGSLHDELSRGVDFEVLPRARETALALAARDRTAVGVGTGNVRAGADAKLARAGLADLFSFGGYGCDHEERAEVLRAGAGRGAEKLGISLAKCTVVVIGDTVRDIDAARAIGARCVGVGTGGVSLDALRDAGADVVFDSLASEGALETLVALTPR